MNIYRHLNLHILINHIHSLLSEKPHHISPCQIYLLDSPLPLCTLRLNIIHHRRAHHQYNHHHHNPHHQGGVISILFFTVTNNLLLTTDPSCISKSSSRISFFPISNPSSGLSPRVISTNFPPQIGPVL